MPELKDVEVFKAGTHTDSSGHERAWSLDDIKSIAEKYNNQSAEEKHVAPLVLGHPEDNAPAYGWVKQLKVVGDKLLADFEKVSDEFVQWLKDGQYRTRSIALYGDLMLRHIGFLGAVPPAVKGLSDVKLNNGSAYNRYDFISSRELRSKRFQISLKDIGFEEKPVRYQSLSDDDFADPVNYRFPTSRLFIRGTLATWGRESVRKAYSDREQEIIAARIITSALRENIALDPKKYGGSQHVEVPAESLTKKQLIDALNGTLAPKQDNAASTGGVKLQEKPMDILAMLNAMLNEAMTQISESNGEEVASQISAIFTPIIEKTAAELQSQIQAQDTGSGGAEGGTDGGFSEKSKKKSKVELEFEKRVQALEEENREFKQRALLSETKQFMDGLVSKGSPIGAVKDLATQTLLAAASYGQAFAFSDSKGKQQKGTLRSMLEQVFSELPAIVEHNEIAKDGQKTTTGSSTFKDQGDVHKAIMEYIDEEAKKGRTLTFQEALLEFEQKYFSVGV